MRKAHTEHCRYFANGICSKGNACTYIHDVSKRNENICQFNLAGKCSFGDSCRFLHTRPRNEVRIGPMVSYPSFSVPPPPIPTRNVVVQKVRPVQLAKPGLNTQAAEFVPSWKKNPAGPPSSYASAAAGPSTSNASDPAHLQNLYLCPYYEKNGECYRKETDCPFGHGDKCDMCRSWCLHPYNEQKRKEHQTECANRHQREMERAFLLQRAEDKTCGVCMENIVEKNLRFGILNGCQHCFCLACIRQWRSRASNMELTAKTVRSCPECRQHSDYVIPSMFWVEKGDEKTVLIEMYKENMRTKKCKYYTNPRSRGDCPFGNKCFYRHELPDGSLDPGESPNKRRRPRLAEFLGFDDDEEEEDEDEFTGGTEFDRLVEEFLREAMRGRHSPEVYENIDALIGGLRFDDNQ